MSNASKYFEVDAVNWSTLSEMRRSPAHYLRRATAPREDTPRLAMGRAVHCAVLEPGRFERETVVFDGPVRRGKAWDAFLEANADRLILKPTERETCLEIARLIHEHPVAGPLLTEGVAEMPVYWTDPVTGLACKALPDWRCTGQATFLDLKTARDAEQMAFGRSAARYGYANQLAWYQEGLRRSGIGELAPLIVAVELEPPHDVTVFTLDEDLLGYALAECMELLQRVAGCRATKKWPGRYAEPMPLVLPRWAYPDDSEDASDLGLKFGE